MFAKSSNPTLEAKDISQLIKNQAQGDLKKNLI